MFQEIGSNGRRERVLWLVSCLVGVHDRRVCLGHRGFYGPSVFLQSLHESRGWPISQVSMAITAHFLLSAINIAYLPDIHRRLGIAKTTFLGAALTAAGLNFVVQFT